MRHIITFALLYSILVTTSNAQTTSQNELAVSPTSAQKLTPALQDSPVNNWALLQKRLESTHPNLQLSTKASPKKMQKCRLFSIAADVLLCGTSPQKQKSFSKDEIEAVYTATHTDHAWIPITSIFWAGSGGVAYGAYIVGSMLAASFPLGIFAFILFCVGAMGIAFSAESTGGELLYKSANDTKP